MTGCKAPVVVSHSVRTEHVLPGVHTDRATNSSHNDHVMISAGSGTHLAWAGYDEYQLRPWRHFQSWSHWPIQRACHANVQLNFSSAKNRFQDKLANFSHCDNAKKRSATGVVGSPNIKFSKCGPSVKICAFWASWRSPSVGGPFCVVN